MGLCGPTGGEVTAANAESGFAQTMVNTFNTQLASQTATLAQINTNLQNLATGNTPLGFSPNELSLLRGGAVTNTSQLFRNAMQRQGLNFSAQGGGGTSGLVTGPQQQVLGDIAAAAAGKEADLLTGIDLQNYQLGRENLIAATTGLERMAQLQAPEAYASEAGGALGKSFEQQHTMSEESSQALAEIGGLVTGGIGAATGLGKFFSKGPSPNLGPMPGPATDAVGVPIGAANYPSVSAPDIGVGAGLAAFQIPDMSSQP